MKPDKDLRLPPNDDEAEEAVIGSLLIDGDSIELVSSSLNPNDFYFEQNRSLYAACLELNKRHEAINQVTLAQEITRTGKPELCGGSARLAYLISVTPTSMDIEHYAGIVSRLSTSRQMISAGERISAIGYEAEPDTASSMARLEAIVKGIQRSNSGSVDIINPKDRANTALERYNNLKNLTIPPGLPTGFRDIDRLYGGGQLPGETSFFCARSQLGKSTMMINIIRNQSRVGDVLLCSGEMTKDSLTDKEVAMDAGLTVMQIRAGRYSDDEHTRIINALGELALRHCYILPPPLTIPRIRQAAYYMAAHGNLVSIWIDYLQKIELFGDKNENTYRKVGNITGALTLLAKEVNAPMNVLSQIGRDLDRRENKRPLISDIYESGIVENDADWIFLLHRMSHYYTEEEWNLNYPNESERIKRGWNGFGYNERYPRGLLEIHEVKSRFDNADTQKLVKLEWHEQDQTYKDI